MLFSKPYSHIPWLQIFYSSSSHLFFIMISKHDMDAEVRDYSLNAAKTVKRKLKMAFTNVAIKSGGQCIVAQLNAKRRIQNCIFFVT